MKGPAAERVIFESPWMALVERMVRGVDANGRPDSYYVVRQGDYVSILAVTPDGRIPLVRQYRPAVRRFTLELPAGTVERGKSAIETCRMELLEETGLHAARIYRLGRYLSDTGRMTNSTHNFYVETLERRPRRTRAHELATRYVTSRQLLALTRARRFNSQLHLGTLCLALLHPRSASLLVEPK